LWNPYIGTGVPVAEALSPALLHPFTLLLVVLPFEHALTVLAVVRLTLAGAGAFTLARVLGCALPASALAGTLFMLSPLHLSYRFHTVPNVSALLPFLLAVSELRVRGASPRRCVAAWSLLGTLMIFGGHAETCVHATAVAWTYHLLRALGPAPEGHPRWVERLARALFFLVTSTTLAGLGGAVIILGHVDMVLDSQVMQLRELAGAFPRLPWSHLSSFLVPQLSGFRSPAYLGILTLILTAGGMVAPGIFPAWPFILIGTGAFLAAYGAWPMAAVLQRLPLVGVADNAKLIFVVHLALALLAARGLEGLGIAAARTSMAAATALVPVGFVWLWLSGVSVRQLDPLHLALLLGVAGLMIAGGSWIVRRRSLAWVVAGLVFADLYTALGPSPRSGPGSFPAAPAVVAQLAGSPADARTFVPETMLPINVNMVYDLPSISCYEVLPIRTIRLLASAGLKPSILGVHAPDQPKPHDLRLLSLLNVRYLLTARPLQDPSLGARLEEVQRTPVAVYRNPDAFDRAFVVQEAQVVRTPEEALARLDDPAIDLRRVVILESPLPPDLLRVPPTGEPAPTAKVVEYRPGHARMVTRSTGGGVLVFSETFCSGWHAEVDGRATPVLRADYALLGVPLPAGQHDVRLTYRPTQMLVGGAVTLVTILALVLAVIPASVPRSKLPLARPIEPDPPGVEVPARGRQRS
jgi:hypothetical protein